MHKWELKCVTDKKQWSQHCTPDTSNLTQPDRRRLLLQNLLDIMTLSWVALFLTPKWPFENLVRGNYLWYKHIFEICIQQGQFMQRKSICLRNTVPCLLDPLIKLSTVKKANKIWFLYYCSVILRAVHLIDIALRLAKYYWGRRGPLQFMTLGLLSSTWSVQEREMWYHNGPLWSVLATCHASALFEFSVRLSFSIVENSHDPQFRHERHETDTFAFYHDGWEKQALKYTRHRL